MYDKLTVFAPGKAVKSAIFAEVRQPGHKLTGMVEESNDAPATGAARVMGLDVGDRRVGVAVSDEMGVTAQPVLTLTRTNRKQDLKSLGRLLRRYACREIVVGNPLYMSGDVSPQALKAQAFAEQLRQEFGLPVHLWDERLTTTEAHRHLHAAGHAESEHKGMVDQVAAVLILESFMAARRAKSGSAG